MGTLKIDAVVTADANAKYEIELTSSDSEVAVISQDGQITLKDIGETVISATAGEKYYGFVLIVNESVGRYTVTVNGGTANKTSAIAGEIITLTPSIPTGKQFVRWEYSEEVEVSGHTFVMPAKEISITAVYEDIFYTLNVVGGEVVLVDGETEHLYEGTFVENVKDGTDPRFDVYAYQLPYGAALTFKPYAIGEYKFVDWTYKTNTSERPSSVDTYNFTMIGEDCTLTANYTNKYATIDTAELIQEGDSVYYVLKGHTNGYWGRLAVQSWTPYITPQCDTTVNDDYSYVMKTDCTQWREEVEVFTTRFTVDNTYWTEFGKEGDVRGVMLTETQITHSNMYISGAGDLASVVFSDKTLTTEASFVEGENTITLHTLPNSLRGTGGNGSLGGPMIDCIKITTDAKVTFTEHKDNPDQRGAI